jgi:shikimate kinase
MRIFLLGFMGSGKSTLGKELSAKIAYSFIDLDSEIEEKAGKNISSIFETDGEEKFRELEHQCLMDTLINDNCVIATGGGTPCFFNNMDIINENGFAIYIKFNAGVLASRLYNAKSERPLLKNIKTQSELQRRIEQLLEIREEFYEQSSMIVEGMSMDAKRLSGILKELGIGG